MGSSKQTRGGESYHAIRDRLDGLERDVDAAVQVLKPNEEREDAGG